MTPRFYFSFRSPYSWLAYRDLVRHHRDLCGRLSWVPFWEPDDRLRSALACAGGRFSYVDMSRAKARYILQDVRRLADARGLTLTWPVDRQPWWEVPHLAYLVAAGHGRGPEFIERTYRARWERGHDICRPDTIGEIAAELGLDPQEHAHAASSPAARAQGLRVLLAMDRDGVFGVPFFVHGHDRYWGVDRLAQFAGALRRAGGPPVPADLADLAGHDVEPIEPGADQGHAGGCG